MVFAAALLAVAGCEKDKNDQEGNKDFKEYDGYFVYKNDEYKTVKLADGSVWMAEPMRYVPEGFTPSGDPAQESHIWKPYTIADGVPASSDDAALLRKNGYLYDLYAAFGGKEITADNAASFEGTQGICPDGWHIPTRADWLSLCGYSNKAEGETTAPVNKEALFYDEKYNGGKISLFNEASWNFVLSGWRQKTGYTAAASYFKTAISSATSTVEEWYGLPTMTYLISSTVYKPNYVKDDPTTLSNIQFFAGMTTINAKSYPEGRVTLAFQHCESGAQLRCVKNK